MARTKKIEKSIWPTIIRGNHSTRIEYSDGRVEFIIHWDELARDVHEAIASYELSKLKPAKTGKKKSTKKIISEVSKLTAEETLQATDVIRKKRQKNKVINKK